MRGLGPRVGWESAWTWAGRSTSCTPWRARALPVLGVSIVTFELVLSHLRKRDFAVLSTISKGDHRGESEYLAGRPFDETASVVSPATDHPVARSSPDRGLD